jgi:hypothetical protein
MTKEELNAKKQQIQDLFDLLNTDISLYQNNKGKDQLEIFLYNFQHNLQGLQTRFNSLSSEMSKEV